MISAEMLELIMGINSFQGINSLQGIFKAEQLSGCAVNTCSTPRLHLIFVEQTNPILSCARPMRCMH